MKYLLKDAVVFRNQAFQKADILICDGIISDIGNISSADGAVIFSFPNCHVFPGFTDVHVHLRQPGFSYKETVESGTLAAAHGGYTSVCAMPNLKPCPDRMENLKQQLSVIETDARVHVYPYAAITKGENGEELSDMGEMFPYVCGFSDDGRGVQSEEMMEKAMNTVKQLGGIIAAHCEDNSLLNGGYIHDGEYAKKHGHRGICSESEWKPIERDIALAKKTGCKYHVCHISAKESVELIRKAKADGVDITCETGPHYLTMNDMCLEEDGRFKMNPPIRSEQDRQALIEGLLDGTIDMIATDHAPHSAEEKSRGLEKSLMGVVGLETAFPVCYTKLVRENIISLEKLVDLLFTNAKKRFGIGTEIEIGQKANLSVFDLNEKYKINSEDFLSMGRATPFLNMQVYGKNKMTIVDGGIVWQERSTEK